MAKVKVISAWLDACSGCHMSFLDLDEAVVGLADKIELLATPITDIKEFTPADVGIIEGAVSNEHDEEVAKKIRANCKILMVWGDCACFGGICAMRNLFPKEEVLQRYYSTESTSKDSKIPSSEDLPPLTEVRPVNQVVKVDCYVPGCPPSAKAIHYALAALLEGRIPVLPGEIMRFD
ncbi:MAG: NADP oxidoreductase [Dehalococcoidia bacterium]|nr:MAG: NADP oxidoreductase [Dehalococcoidia bacterium]